MAVASSWLVWQLADSAFPSGGFAHSGGLEAAWQLGEVPSRKDLAPFARASLRQQGYAALPFMLAAHRNPDRFGDLDERCDVFLNNHVANRASRLQGQAFLTVAQRSFGLEKPPMDHSARMHLAPVLGWVTRRFGMAEEDAARLLLFLALRGLISAAVRLGVVGPLEGQQVQHRLAGAAEETWQACRHLSVEEACQTAPLLDLYQGAQDRLYSRLFQS